MNKFGILIAAIVLGAPTVGSSAGLPWYAGVTGGASSLRPDTQSSAWTLDSEVSFGGGVFVGYDFSRRFSFELGYNYLGSATLKNDTGTTDIGYTALSAGALMYLLGDANDIADRNGFAGYLRLGVSSMDNSAVIRLDREDNMAVMAGIGAEWPLTTSLSLRGELTSFDGDAQALRASVLYRPRAGTQRGTPVARAPQRPQVPQVQPQAPQPMPQQVPQRAPQSVPKVIPAPTVDTRSNCSAPVANEPSDAQGCALFSGKLRGVEFVSGTASLTPVAAQLLDRLAQNLTRNPSVKIEIQGHTESFGNEARAKEIAKQRTLAVARHLAGRGVSVQRLKARAFGHSQPLVADTSTAGRRQNNRIELRVFR